MAFFVRRDVRIFPDLETLSRAAARSVFEFLVLDAHGRERISIALAGGNTPRDLYLHLSAEYGSRIPWEHVHLFWGDERFVPPDHPDSNYHMARETLLNAISIPHENVHPIPTDFAAPEQAALSYEKALRSFFITPLPRFDLIFLGVGADGHTASLFPRASALEETERWVIATEAPFGPSHRITLTLSVLNHAARIYFLVSGAAKAQALARVLTSSNNQELPASFVQPCDGSLAWWVDSGAARFLGSTRA